MTFTVGHVALISRASFHDPFRIRWEVPLGGDDRELTSEQALRSCRQVDVPYVATCGPGLLGADTDSVRCNYRASRADAFTAACMRLIATVPLVACCVLSLAFVDPLTRATAVQHAFLPLVSEKSRWVSSPTGVTGCRRFGMASGRTLQLAYGTLRTAPT